MKNDIIRKSNVVFNDIQASQQGDAMNRREFLKKIGCAGAGLALVAVGQQVSARQVDEMPKRVLGRTNEKVSILGLGTAPAGEGPVDVQEGIKIFSEAIDHGVTYIDTARIYGNAEEILGHLIPKRRDKLFVVSKVSTDNGERAERSLAESLRLLKTDYLDLVHIHSIGSKNIDRVLAKNGVLEYLLKQKEAGKIRFIGISGHNRPPNFVRMLKTGQIDVVMCVLNYADRNIYDFESKVLPEARKLNVGCVAMKVYVGIKGGFRNHRSGYIGCVTEPAYLPNAMAYALDLEGVSVAVVGPYTVEQSIQNVQIARKYKPLSNEQRTLLLEYGRKLAPSLGPRYGAIS
ncbi:MAG: aldo/keto reductase [Planctomycetota bacterium]|jgi:predicted aldo/keto reductase-like oxidoreductase